MKRFNLFLLSVLSIFFISCDKEWPQAEKDTEIIFVIKNETDAVVRFENVTRSTGNIPWYSSEFSLNSKDEYSTSISFKKGDTEIIAMWHSYDIVINDVLIHISPAESDAMKKTPSDIKNWIKEHEEKDSEAKTTYTFIFNDDVEKAYLNFVK